MKKYVIGLLLGVMLLLSFGKPMEAVARENNIVSVACAVPLPPSAPGEEKKDMITALIGLAVLGVIVVGGISYLKKNFSENE